jgi:hypothetical protein
MRLARCREKREEAEGKLDLGRKAKAAEWKEKQTGARSSGRLIRLDRRRFLVQQGASKV